MALVSCHFFSHVLGLASTMTVLLPDLPPGTGSLPSPPAGPFPVLYLLHGLSDDHTIWQRRTSLERYLEGMNLAVVMPAVQRSFYADSLTGQRYWTFISEELPAIARAYFPLSAARAESYVAGLSMGGYGAFKLALSHPDRFAAAASLSGALDIVRLLQAEAEIGDDERRLIFGRADEVAGGPNDLFYLAEQAAGQNGPLPALYQACGTEDHLYGDNVHFHAHARSLGLEVAYSESPAGHVWSYWDEQIQRVLAWLPGLEPR